MSQSAPLVSLDLPCDRHAPATVRRALDEAGSPGPLLDDSRLVASELVSNAVLHSNCAGDHRIEVSTQLFDDHLLISVHDPGLSGEDATPSSGQHGGGWGLRIVDRLSRRWGSDRPDGYRVWAELAVPG